MKLYILGLKASCEDVRNFNGDNLIKILKTKMKSFPKKEFNNFYQFGIGVIALHVYDEFIPSMFGEMILKGVFIGKKRHAVHKTKNSNYISDTEVLSLLALSAIDQQKFVAHWTRKHIHREMKKALKKLDKILLKPVDNLVTRSHVMQVNSLS